MSTTFFIKCNIYENINENVINENVLLRSNLNYKAYSAFIYSFLDDSACLITYPFLLKPLGIGGYIRGEEFIVGLFI